MPRLVGKGIAHELILTGEMISADEALRIGLVNRVVEPGDLLSTAEAIAKKIIANAPIAVQYAMEAVERYGAVRGSFMAVARLLRCHPLAKGGYDPVVRKSDIHLCSGRHGSAQVSS